MAVASDEVCNRLGAGAALPLAVKKKPKPSVLRCPCQPGLAAGGCCNLAVFVPCFAWCSLHDTPGDRSCLPHGCGTRLVPGSARGEDAPSTARLANAAPSALEGEAR